MHTSARVVSAAWQSLLRAPARRGKLSIPALLALLMCGCDPNFTRNGEDGDPPPETESEVSLTVNLDGFMVRTVDCGSVVYYDGECSQRVASCDGVNFQSIYNEAYAMASAMSGQLQCFDQNCPEAASWIDWHAWSCDRNSLTARAIVVLGATCAELVTVPIFGEIPNAPLGLVRPTLRELGAPSPQTGVVSASTGSNKAMLSGSRHRMRCNPAEVASVTVRTRATPRPFSLAPYVAEAEQLAAARHQTVQCAGCLRKSFEPTRRTWKWENDLVTVSIYWKPCGPP